MSQMLRENPADAEVAINTHPAARFRHAMSMRRVRSTGKPFGTMRP
jgi:hypothetical protein